MQGILQLLHVTVIADRDQAGLSTLVFPPTRRPGKVPTRTTKHLDLHAESIRLSTKAKLDVREMNWLTHPGQLQLSLSDVGVVAWSAPDTNNKIAAVQKQGLAVMQQL